MGGLWAFSLAGPQYEFARDRPGLPVPTQKKICEEFCAIRFEKLAYEDAQGHICNPLEGGPPGGLLVCWSRGRRVEIRVPPSQPATCR